MPPHLRDRFTPGEQAVMFVISAEVREHGRCERCIGEIAARAGVGRTTTQNAIRQAVKLGLVTLEERRRPGQRSLPNMIHIISWEWRAWIERGPRQPAKGGGFKALNTTESPGFSRRVEDRSEHDRGAGREGRSPPVRPRWSARHSQPALECRRGEEARAVSRQGLCPAP